ncbi:MAG: MBL fold metallo-hydrolase [Dehalococcoidales bacterium]|nr:MBL fold metallo-hydrolase [Dehalococcoidales bacterium]
MPEITPGIILIKLPIGEIDDVGGPPHINAYLVRGDNGYLLVDAGWNTDSSFGTMHNTLVKNGLGFEEISQIFVTHVHPDHYGMAGRIKKLSGATIAMHPIEKDLIDPRYVHMEELLHQTDSMLVDNGVPHDQMVKLRDATVGLENFIDPTPPDITLRDGDTVTTGEFTFQVIWTPGHSSGHLCLYEPQKKILLSGDHILPRITPNISVHPQSIENPLGRYVESLKELKKLNVELVLPGHDEPFTGFAARIDEIIHHHELRSREILDKIEGEPRTTYQIARLITWGENSRWQDLPEFHQRMAIFETLAHLEMMANESIVTKLPGKGIIYYRQN